MSAGHIVAGQCVDVATSADVFFSSFPPSVSSGSITYETFFTKVANVWQIKGISISETGVVTNRYQIDAQLPTFQTCSTTEQFFDGLTIGWAVAAALFAAWAIKNLRRAL